MQLCGFEVGLNRPFFLIAGPCVIEGESMAIDIAAQMKETTDALGIPYIFKASFDKANRTSETGFRGPGMEAGLRILAKVRETVGVPVLTDVHTADEVPFVAEVVDVLQTPAFLCRQTDFIHACAVSGKPVNIKKGQFLAPGDMKNVVEKARAAAARAGLSTDRFMVCERGASFGYGNLVSDMRSLAIMRETDAPVVFDATHSVQLPGGNGSCSSGKRQLCRCSRVRQQPSALRASSWKRIRIPKLPRATAPTWCRSARCARCLKASLKSTASSKRVRSLRTSLLEAAASTFRILVLVSGFGFARSRAARTA